MIQITTETGIALVLGLCSVVGFLFRALMASKNETIKAKDETIAWLLAELGHTLKTNERATAAAETATSLAKDAYK